jgi:hypothetical protein
MSWLVTGLIAGVVAYLVDWVMWSYVFNKGMDAFVTPPAVGQPLNMGPMLAKSAVLSLVFGLLLAYLYARFRGSLWVQGGGPLAGMEFGAVLWLPTIALETLGGGVWYVKVRPLYNATFWVWLVRLLAAGLVVGLLIK